jgi:hypothetical protein
MKRRMIVILMIVIIFCVSTTIHYHQIIIILASLCGSIPDIYKVVEQTSSPQYHVLQWLAQHDGSVLAKKDTRALLERYVMAATKFELGRDFWLSSEQPTCDWFPRIHCNSISTGNDDKRGRSITGLSLGKWNMPCMISLCYAEFIFCHTETQQKLVHDAFFFLLHNPNFYHLVRFVTFRIIAWHIFPWQLLLFVIDYKQLSGSIPTELALMTNLKKLELVIGGNNFSLSIPTQLALLTNLNYLYLCKFATDQ